MWLPSVGVTGPLPPIWGFDPPDGFIQGTGTESLLGNSAICTTGVPSRQTDHGIQSGCE